MNFGRKINLKVEKSNYPEGEKTHILVMESSTNRGFNYQRIFKGTKEECIQKKNEIEGTKTKIKRRVKKNVSKPKTSRTKVSRKKQNNK